MRSTPIDGRVYRGAGGMGVKGAGPGIEGAVGGGRRGGERG